jgi:hypothetical protein
MIVKCVVWAILGFDLYNQQRKKGKPNIAPLQLPTLASYQTWGNSVGASRTGLPPPK